MGTASGPAAADVIVIGAGLIGLATADALAARGARVLLLGEDRPGMASAAAAGMLAPTVEPIVGPALDFAIAARDRFPAYLEALESTTGIHVPIVSGILELGQSVAHVARIPGGPADELRWLDPDDVARLEPRLAAVTGAVLHPLDGAVDNVALLAAVARRVEHDARIRWVPERAATLERGGAGAIVRTTSGSRHEAPVLVLAAGAWSGLLEGLPRPLPVEPSRGQMIALGAAALRHVIFSDAAYLVPRGDRVLVGATMESVGFDDATTPEAQRMLREAAVALVPSLRDAPIAAAWAGLRPMTPDGLPILGRDPDWPSMLYACGHSRNGILMAPLSGECVASLALGEEPPASLVAFDVGRFEANDA